MNRTPLPRPTAFAHSLVGKVVAPGDVVVDTTVGNGHDTEFLARLCGPGGKVIGFDIQPAAIEATQARLAPIEGLAKVELHCESHAALAARVSPGVAAVMCNLGYLPSGDHAVITTAEETIPALAAALQVLKSGGLLTIVCYPGHPGGAEEAEAVGAWAEVLGSGVRVARYEMLATKQPAPFLIAVEKARC